MDFFAGPVMTELAQSPQVKRGIPRFLPDALWTPSPTKPVSTTVKYKAFSGNRQAAQLVHHGSSSREQEVPGSQWKYQTALGSREHFVVDQEFLYALKSDQPYVSGQARNEFVKRVGDFQERFNTLRTNVVNSTFALGKIYIDDSGNVLPSSSGANTARTIDFGVTSLSTGSNITNNTSVQVGDWSSASTDIPTKIRAIVDGFIFGTNYIPKTVMYGASIPGYFYGNTAMQAYLSRQPMLNEKFMMTNEVPAGLLDLNWVAAHRSYMVKSDNTVAKWFPDNQITIIAEPDDTWYEFYEAGSAVPTGLASPDQSLDSLLASIRIVNGKFGYVEMSTDPIKLKAITGDYFLPAVKNGSVVWIITVS
jgi:hypothetical protein